jgi:hypothetical protein
MIRRMFSGDTPTITFTKDYRQLLHGDLLPGRSVRIKYDADRLPADRSDVTKAFYKFVESAEPQSTELHSKTGRLLTKVTLDTGEGTMITGQIEIPGDADHLTIWFLNVGKSGEQYWDSNHGKNYIVRFTTEDIDIDSVEVSGGMFRIAVNASPEISDLAVHYRIMNTPAGPNAAPEQVLRLTRSGEKWSGSVPVLEGAVIRFTVHYQAYGNPYADTNNGKGYLTWAGAVADHEAGVV